ncbi:MAG: hypothetical protein JXR56_00795 [Candidatus Cloacimonetes bacterium]|nr:hypothetical protein [Candidatus Cloacimonadota bacterium]
MKRLILKLVILTLLILSSDIIIGILLRPLISKIPNGRYFKIYHTFYKTDAEMVLIGSSACETGVNPEILEKQLGLTVWNGARGDQTLLYFEVATDKLLERKKVKTIVYFIESMRFETEIDISGISQLKPLTIVDKSLIPYISQGRKLEEYFLKSNLYACNSLSYYLIRPMLSSKSIDGGVETKGQKVKIGSKSSLLNYKYKGISFKGVYNQQKVDRYLMMFKKCRDQNVNVIVITLPRCNPPYELSRTIDTLKSMQDEGLFRYFDYYTDQRFIHKPEFFYDEGHFNKEGANYFSEILAKDLFDSCSLRK